MTDSAYERSGLCGTVRVFETAEAGLGDMQRPRSTVSDGKASRVALKRFPHDQLNAATRELRTLLVAGPHPNLPPLLGWRFEADQTVLAFEAAHCNLVEYVGLHGCRLEERDLKTVVRGVLRAAHHVLARHGRVHLDMHAGNVLVVLGRGSDDSAVASALQCIEAQRSDPEHDPDDCAHWAGRARRPLARQVWLADWGSASAVDETVRLGPGWHGTAPLCCAPELIDDDRETVGAGPRGVGTTVDAEDRSAAWEVGALACFVADVGNHWFNAMRSPAPGGRGESPQGNPQLSWRSYARVMGAWARDRKVDHLPGLTLRDCQSVLVPGSGEAAGLVGHWEEHVARTKELSRAFADFLCRALALDPSRRATLAQLLDHPWLAERRKPSPIQAGPQPLPPCAKELATAEVRLALWELCLRHQSALDVLVRASSLYPDARTAPATVAACFYAAAHECARRGVFCPGPDAEQLAREAGCTHDALKRALSQVLQSARWDGAARVPELRHVALAVQAFPVLPTTARLLEREGETSPDSLVRAWMGRAVAALAFVKSGTVARCHPDTARVTWSTGLRDGLQRLSGRSRAVQIWAQVVLEQMSECAPKSAGSSEANSRVLDFLLASCV